MENINYYEDASALEMNRKKLILRVAQFFLILTSIVGFLQANIGWGHTFTIVSILRNPWAYLFMLFVIIDFIFAVLSAITLNKHFAASFRLLFLGTFPGSLYRTLMYGGVLGIDFYTLGWILIIVYVTYSSHRFECYLYVFIAVLGWTFSIIHTEFTLDSFLMHIWSVNGAYIHQMQLSVYFYSFGMSTLIFITLVFLYAKRTATLEKYLKLQAQRNDLLLKSVFPPSIVERIYESGSTNICDAFKDVCVFFADLTNFSSISATIPPTVLVQELNAIYDGIDLIAEKYGIEKIKTIGDGYLAICGAPEEVVEPQKKMVRFGLEVLHFIEGYKQHSAIPDLGIRIGIDTGPLVAGVIGVNRQTYDIWGNTVNRASRLEAYGVPGKLNISKDVYEHISQEFTHAKKWTPDLKGFGKTTAYLL